MSNRLNKSFNKNKRGFMATIAITTLSYSILAIIAVVLVAVNSYVDNVYLFESRIEVRKNMKACITKAERMLAADYFLSGNMTLPEFGCDTVFTDVAGASLYQEVLLGVITRVGPVVMMVEETIELHDYYIKVIDRHIKD